MAEWWEGTDYGLYDTGGSNWWDFGGFDFGFDPSWFDFTLPDFNFDWAMPEFNWAMPSMDPLALPSYNDFFLSGVSGQQPEFPAWGIPSPEMQAPPPPVSLADLGYGGPSAAPNTALPAETLPPGLDQIVNLQGTDQGLGNQGGLPDYLSEPKFPDLGLTTGVYGGPGGVAEGGSEWMLEGRPYTLTGALGGTPQAQPGGAPVSTTASGGNKWETIAKLAAAFGPTALGAAGLGLQAANRPKRNPLEDELLRARIASTGLQDALAKDRLAFEREQAGAQLEAQREALNAQREMQNALLASRRPGGAANIQGLLASDPRFRALYERLTSQSTALAGGSSPEFDAMLDQVAGVQITALQRQAEEQKDQAMELAARQGINPAGIIAKIDQELLQQIAAARVQARQVLIQMMQPGANLLNSIGGLFGALYQSPAAG